MRAALHIVGALLGFAAGWLLAGSPAAVPTASESEACVHVPYTVAECEARCVDEVQWMMDVCEDMSARTFEARQ